MGLAICGCRASSCTFIASSRMFRNLCRLESVYALVIGLESTHWSTDLSTPVIDKSFFSSTVTSWSVNVLNTENINCRYNLISPSVDPFTIDLNRLTMVVGGRRRVRAC